MWSLAGNTSAEGAAPALSFFGFLFVCAAFVSETLTHLPGQPVSAVHVNLPLADSSDQQTLRPPQLLVLFDDVMPQLAGPRGAAQTLCVQLPKDLHAHFYRQRFCKVRMGGVIGGRQAGSFFTEHKRRRAPDGVMLHNRSGSDSWNSLGEKVMEKWLGARMTLIQETSWIMSAPSFLLFDVVHVFISLIHFSSRAILCFLWSINVFGFVIVLIYLLYFFSTKIRLNVTMSMNSSHNIKSNPIIFLQGLWINMFSALKCEPRLD